MKSRLHALLVLSVSALLLVRVPACSAQTPPPQQLTPLLLAVHDAPVPFMGSDGNQHLVYELWMTNFSSAEAVVKQVEVLGDGLVLQKLDASALGERLQPAGQRASNSTIAKSATSLLFLHIIFRPGAPMPARLTHRVAAHFSAAPPGHQDFSEEGGPTAIDHLPVAQIGPPLRGDGYISADSCCDASRHTRAALPVNGRVFVAQRYAVDWEQLDANRRIYSGPESKVGSYTIFGKPVLAVATATVVAVIKGMAEQTPGKYPVNIPLDEAEGNTIVLDLGEHRYAVYAHLQSASIRLRKGDKVKRGQVIALVGNSGNSVAPHLHFQVINSQVLSGSNGLPYEIDNFTVSAKTPGTEAFDKAEAQGTALAITPFAPPLPVRNALPLDQLIISFEPVMIY